MMTLLSKATQLWQSKGVQDTLVTVVGNALGTAMSAVAIILISRILGPEKFGVFSVGFAIVLILTRFNEIGLNTVILKMAPNLNSAKQQALYSWVFRAKLMVSVLFVVFGLVSFMPLAKFFDFSQPSILLSAFTVGLATVYYEHLLSVLQSLHRFKQAVIINAIQAFAKLAGAIFFFTLWQPSVLVIFSWYVVAPLVPLFFGKWLLPSWYRFQVAVTDGVNTKRVISLAKHSSVALMAAGIIENVDVLFVQKYLTTYETGLYGGVTRIALLFTLVAYSLGNVLNPRVAQYKTKLQLSAYLKKALGLLVLSLMGFLVFLPLASPFIWLTVGPEYLPGTTILIIMTAASFITVASMPFIALFFSFDTDWYFSVSGLLQLLVILGGNLLFVPEYGLEAAAWTRFASRLVLFGFTTILASYIYYKNYVKVTSTD